MDVNDGKGGPQQYYMRTGMDSVLEKWMRTEDPKAAVKTEDPKLRTEHIHLGRRVLSITQPTESEPGSERAVVVTEAVGGGEKQTYLAKQVVVAAAPHTIGRAKGGITFSPPLSDERSLLNSQKMGRTIKCVTWYKSAWWRESHGIEYNGYGGAPCELNPLTWVMDNSADPMNSASGVPMSIEERRTEIGAHPELPALMTFTVASQVDNLWTTDDQGNPVPPGPEVIQELVTRSIAFFFNDERGLQTSSEFEAFHYFNWDKSEQHVGGGPVTIMGQGVLTKCAAALDASHGTNVHFASSENAKNLNSNTPRNSAVENKWVPSDPSKPNDSDDAGIFSDKREGLGYMDGALLSGEYVANQVANALANKPLPPLEAPKSPSGPPTDDKPAAWPPGVSNMATPKQVRKCMEAIVSLLYLSARPKTDHWEKTDWQSNNVNFLPDKLMVWLELSLIWAGIIPIYAAFKIGDKVYNMDEVLAKAAALLEGAQDFLAKSPATLDKAELAMQADVRNLAAVASQLSLLLSNEPTGPRPTGPKVDNDASKFEGMPKDFAEFVAAHMG